MSKTTFLAISSGKLRISWVSDSKMKISRNSLHNFPVVISFYYGSIITFIIIPDTTWALSRFLPQQLPWHWYFNSKIEHSTSGGKVEEVHSWPWARKSLATGFWLCWLRIYLFFLKRMDHPFCSAASELLQEERRKSLEKSKYWLSGWCLDPFQSGQPVRLPWATQQWYFETAKCRMCLALDFATGYRWTASSCLGILSKASSLVYLLFKYHCIPKGGTRQLLTGAC